MQKCENKKLILKKYTSPASDFLLHNVEAIGKLEKIILKNVEVQLMSLYYINEFHIIYIYMSIY